MKKIMKLLVFFLLSLALFGCTSLGKGAKDKALKTSQVDSKEVINYEVDSIKYKESFHNIEAYCQAMRSGDSQNDLIVMISLGLVNTKDVSLEAVDYKDNTINFYVRKNDSDLEDYLIPQIATRLNLDELDKIDDLDKINFNIVALNYQPLQFDISLADILSKISSSLKIYAPSMADISLINEDDDFYWNIKYNNSFDYSVETIPLVNLESKVSANSGEILDYRIEFVSDSLGQGRLENYADEYLIYKLEDEKGEKLFTYNSDTGETKLLYTSHGDIIQTVTNPANKKCLIVDSFQAGLNNLYLADLKLNNLERIVLEDIDFNGVRWMNDNEILLISSDEILNKTKVFSYKIEEKELELIALNDFYFYLNDYQDGAALITFKGEDLSWHSSYTKDFENFKDLGQGIRAKFFGPDKVAYLGDENQEDEKNLYIYNLKENTKQVSLEKLEHFRIVDQDRLLALQTKEGYKNYDLLELDQNGNSRLVLSTISPEVIFDTKDRIAYLEVSMPPGITDEITRIYYIKIDE